MALSAEEQAELAQHWKDWGRLRARVDDTIQRQEARLVAMLRGETLPVNPMELTDAEWDGVRLEIEAWDEVLARRRR